MQQLYVANDEQGVNSSMTSFVKNLSSRGEKAIENSTAHKAVRLLFSTRMRPAPDAA